MKRNLLRLGVASSIVVGAALVATHPQMWDGHAAPTPPAITQPASPSRPPSPYSYIDQPGVPLQAIADADGTTTLRLEQLNPQINRPMDLAAGTVVYLVQPLLREPVAQTLSTDCATAVTASTAEVVPLSTGGALMRVSLTSRAGVPCAYSGLPRIELHDPNGAVIPIAPRNGGPAIGPARGPVVIDGGGQGQLTLESDVSPGPGLACATVASVSLTLPGSTKPTTVSLDHAPEGAPPNQPFEVCAAPGYPPFVGVGSVATPGA